MFSKQLIFPIQHLEGNLVFTSQEEVMAYYRVPLVNYAHRSVSEKESARLPWIQLFRKLQQDIHLVSIPEFVDLKTHHTQLKQEVADGPLKEQAYNYVDRMMQALQQVQKKPTHQRIYLGIRLRKIRARTSRKKLLKRFTFKWHDFQRYVQKQTDIEPYDILDEELFAYQDQEKKVFEEVSHCLSIQRATVYDLEFLIRHQVYRGLEEKEVTGKWKPRVETKKVRDHEIIQPHSTDISNLLVGEYEVAPQHISLRRLHQGKMKEQWMQFLFLSYLPDDLRFPDEEWLYWLQHLPFPVDVSIRIHVIPNNKAVEMIAKQKRRLGHHVTHTRTEGKQQDLDLEQSYLEAVEEERNLLRYRDPILDTTVVFGVYGATKEEVNAQSQQLINWYQNRNKDMEVVISPGDQLQAFHEFLPSGSSFIQNDFKHKLKPQMVANAMINGSQFLGTSNGMFIGFTGPAESPRHLLDRPVFLDQSLAAQGGVELDTKSLGIALIGLTGYGKSFAAAQLAFQSMHHLGSKVILIDSKGERGNWVTDLPGCQGLVSLTRMGSDPKYRGMLDPFHLFPQYQAPLYAKDFLLQLVQVNRQHEWHHTIQESIQAVKWMKEPSMSKVLEQIQAKDPRLHRILALYESFPFSQLVFGTGEPPEYSLDVGQPLNIIQIDELKIPSREKTPDQYDELELLSKALMTPITGFVNQLVKKNRSFNQIWWEESWIPLASDSGKRAIDEGIRMGRYWNSSTLLVTQNPSDIPRELINNIGIKCIFKTKDETEVTRALEMLEMENNDQNKRMIQNLKEGECLMRDIYGRTGRVYFNCLFQDLAKAFDTTPPPKKAGN